ncbi:uncharacterized protein LOC134528247 isoform X3 [Bacillus rossius redtenbacheri]|uniref:uncharacterized protein LOC134528247 isoform X3 n=1 Tax=Bacillus rossius redtenbacheri TaxID=93214 RepID=UPI002FDE374B
MLGPIFKVLFLFMAAMTLHTSVKRNAMKNQAPVSAIQGECVGVPRGRAQNSPAENAVLGEDGCVPRGRAPLSPCGDTREELPDYLEDDEEEMSGAFKQLADSAKRGGQEAVGTEEMVVVPRKKLAELTAGQKEKVQKLVSKSEEIERLFLPQYMKEMKKNKSGVAEEEPQMSRVEDDDEDVPEGWMKHMSKCVKSQMKKAKALLTWRKKTCKSVPRDGMEDDTHGGKVAIPREKLIMLAGALRGQAEKAKTLSNSAEEMESLILAQEMGKFAGKVQKERIADCKTQEIGSPVPEHIELSSRNETYSTPAKPLRQLCKTEEKPLDEKEESKPVTYQLKATKGEWPEDFTLPDGEELNHDYHLVTLTVDEHWKPKIIRHHGVTPDQDCSSTKDDADMLILDCASCSLRPSSLKPGVLLVCHNCQRYRGDGTCMVDQDSIFRVSTSYFYPKSFTPEKSK